MLVFTKENLDNLKENDIQQIPQNYHSAANWTGNCFIL